MNIVNVFKIHYFLYWGSLSCILNYTLLLITHYGGVKQDETGILYGIQPVFLMFAKPFFCSLADKFAIHEWILISSIVGQTLSYGFFIILAFMIDKAMIWYLFCVLMLFGYTCTGVLTSITDSIVLKIAETENSNFGQMRVWGTIGWGLISYLVGFLNEYELKFFPLYIPGIVLFIAMQIINLILMLCHLGKLRQACKKSEMIRERRLTLQETIEQTISQSMNIHQSMKDPLDNETVNSQSMKSTLNYQSINSNSMKDQLDHAIVSSQSINCNSDEKLVQNHSESQFDNGSLSIKNNKTSTIQSTIKNKKPPAKQITKFVFLTCYAHPMLMKYIFICIIVGMCTALNWNYFPLFLGELKNKDSKLVGYTAFVQCFGSEMPFMYFSGYFIDKIGSKASFNIVLFFFALRYFLYTFFTTQTAYYILFVELTHGITFGLFYYTMNILSREYSKKMQKIEYDYLIENYYKRNYQNVENGASQSITLDDLKKQVKLPENDDSTFATMQGIMSGSFEGFGVAVGSFIGGLLIERKGFNYLWYCFSSIAFLIFIADLLLMSIIYLRHKFKSTK